MQYRPTVSECKHLFNFVNALAFNGIMVSPVFKLKNIKHDGYADIRKYHPGTITLRKIYPCYAMFIASLIHELVHVYIAKVLGDRVNCYPHGKEFKRICKIVKKALPTLDIAASYWAASLTDPRNNKRTNKL